ncbi:MAG: hypothetical protein V1670_02100 [Candidatus Omnitrophota bacterium]
MPEYSQFNNDGERELEGQKAPNPLNKNQKIATAVLAVFALFIFVLWFAQLKNSIKQPFIYNEEDNQQASSVDANSDEALKTKDSDKDGLSDWDELNTYLTSPYLEDSDSDGFSDKQEIDSGKDPNCPAGRDCAGLGAVSGDKNVVNPGENASDNTSTLNNLMNQLGTTPNLQVPAENTTADDSDLLNSVLGNTTDPKVLRQMLLDAGMNKEILDKITDEELMKSYQEMMIQ